MSRNQFSAPVKRLCGHTDLCSFEGSGAASRTADRLYYTSTICSGCATEVTSLAAPRERGFYKVSLPKLHGKSFQIAGANAARIAILRKVGPIMAHADKANSLYSTTVMAAYKALCAVSSAAFWLDNKDSTFHGYWAVTESQHLLRKSTCASVKYGSASAVGYLADHDPQTLTALRETVYTPADQPPDAHGQPLTAA